LAVAAQMKNKGKIVACDVLEKRLKRSSERFRRAGVHNIETKPLKDERDPWVKKHRADFDRVLVDAPCTGTGTWRRNPDARWKSLGPGLSTLVPLQASILDSAARLVKPKGRLIYATCSLLPEENEKQIEAFLETHPDFKLVPFKDIWPEGVSAHPEYLMLTPAQHNTDGFFCAVMESTAAVKPPLEKKSAA
jgi:16S rRNA (cytosine967-C5)-methyltransferase